MKTSALIPARPSTASGARLRRLATVGLVAPVVALSACSGGSPGAADATASTPASTSSATSSTTTAPTTAAAAPATTQAPAQRSVSSTVNASIKDPTLGHTLTARRVVRNFSWPAGQPVGAKQFEIIGVWVTMQAGSRFSASLDPSMLALVAAKPAQTVTPTTEFGKRWGATALKPAKRAQTTSGWVFFKVDRGTGSALRLAFNRPAYQVSTTGKKIPANSFSVVLTK
ncbi:hypothetical protein [Terrabacter sp. BE26]|uniref:hypothetical protein n=1 Tax=Terrabacter sp. BE26 TaxID=2898152 RepID=UPI0035BE81BF